MKQPKLLIIIIIGLIFFAPGIVAYYVFQHPEWLNNTTTNKGQLVRPALWVETLPKNEHWSVILWQPQSCEIECQKQIDQLGRIRLALGRRLYAVDQWLITPEMLLSTIVKEQMEEQKVHWLTLKDIAPSLKQVFGNKPQIFLANPNNYLILSYEQPLHGEYLFQDLQKLLKIAEQ